MSVSFAGDGIRTNGMGSRTGREKRTLDAMIRMFCRGSHGGADVPCGECRELLEYALERLSRCRFGEDKPTCARCPVHCYRPAMRDRIKAVMRHSGPRIVWKHPVLALMHLIDGRRKGKDLPGGR